jgi:hypothetical protein
MTRARFIVCLIAATVAALLLAIGLPAANGDQETPIVVRVQRGGFNWADAGIGVLVGAGLVLAAFGSAALIRTRGRNDRKEWIHDSHRTNR